MNAEFIAEFFKGITKPLPCLNFESQDSSVSTMTFYAVTQVEAGGPSTLCLTDVEMSKYFITIEQYTIISVLSEQTFNRLNDTKDNENLAKIMEKKYDE